MVSNDAAVAVLESYDLVYSFFGDCLTTTMMTMMLDDKSTKSARMISNPTAAAASVGF